MARGADGIDKAEARRLTTVLRCLQAFLQRDGNMTMQLASSFLQVALAEGRSLKDYMDASGLPQSTMSRHLLDLGERDRSGGPGLGLVHRRQDPMELRKNIYTPTSEGRGLVRDILQQLDRLASAAAK